MATLVSPLYGESSMSKTQPEPTSPTPPSLAFIRGPASNCATRTGAACLAGAPTSTGGPTTKQLSWTNTTGAALDVFVIVDSELRSFSATYTLETTLGAP